MDVNSILNSILSLTQESKCSSVTDGSSSINFNNRFSESQSQNIENITSRLNIEPLETDQDSSDSNEVILSVLWKRGKLGAAYYTCHNAELFLLNDVIDVHPEFNNLRSLINQVQPSQVITLGGLTDIFIKTLSDVINGVQEPREETTSELEEPSKKIFFMSGRKKDLGYDSCKRRILGLKLGFEPETSNEEDHILFINSHIDLRQECMVISLGMLIKYLEKYLPQSNLNHDLIQIMFLYHISLTNVVSIDESTYKALQIFNPIVHPSAFKRHVSGTNREGLSLFGIFNRCRSTAGSRRMREIFMSPSKNIDDINERLDAVEFCWKPQHQHIVQNLIDCVKRVDSVTGILASIYRTRAKVSHWKSLYSSLYNSILIGEICQRYSAHSKLFEKIAASVTRNVHEVTHYINQIIDFEESTTKNHFTVRKGINKKLDLLRQTYDQVPEVLLKVAEIELADLPTFIKECSIIYITELGYLLSVPVWKGEGSDISEYSLSDFEVKFIVNKYIHYKTPRCAELDNVLGDILACMSDTESKIMVTLIQFIHTRITDIVKLVRLIAELDCVISFAVVASENNFRRPTLSKDKKIEIIQGRHPLQELCVNNFVPNDTYFGSEEQFIKILTGPNASGKSVYLKQVALIVYLAHIGSFVPAQSAVICVMDHIHSRIQSVESISTRMSAFLLDLSQMSKAIYNSTPQTLIVIDEFGKGTTEIDGLSLLAASLIHFIEREENCPYILVSTHYHSLPELLPPSPLVHLQYMNYIIENEEIVYLHKIKDGRSGSSLTHLAAKAAGISEEALKRSLEVFSGTAPCAPNPNLKVTKIMKKEIAYMNKIFKLIEDDDQETTEERNGSSPVET